MGNQTTRQPLASLKDQQLSEVEQQKLEELIFINESKKFREEYKQFKAKYASSVDLKEMFPVQSQFAPKDTDAMVSDDRLVLNDVIQKMTYGFSSGEYKINELQQGGK